MATKYNITSRYKLDATGITASRIPIDVSTYTTYFVKEGDTLESIASRYLGNQRRFWEIADLNPQIQFPLDIKVGDVIRLPA